MNRDASDLQPDPLPDEDEEAAWTILTEVTQFNTVKEILARLADGRRYLFVNGVRRIRLTDDGLATDGTLEHAATPWRYPAEWVVEMFAPEGPKIFRRGPWFYMVAAVGGTAGPPTSHMVTVARSRSIHGPWQDSPHNPMVRTASADEPWWSRGHATLVEGPAGDWWMVYHGYENGYWTLGRQTLLDPVEWDANGWPHARGGDLLIEWPDDDASVLMTGPAETVFEGEITL